VVEKFRELDYTTFMRDRHIKITKTVNEKGINDLRIHELFLNTSKYSKCSRKYRVGQKDLPLFEGSLCGL